MGASSIEAEYRDISKNDAWIKTFQVHLFLCVEIYILILRNNLIVQPRFIDNYVLVCVIIPYVLINIFSISA